MTGVSSHPDATELLNVHSENAERFGLNDVTIQR